MQKLNALSNTECIEDCNKKWLKCVKQALQWYSINTCVCISDAKTASKRTKQKIKDVTNNKLDDILPVKGLTDQINRD